MLIIFLIVLGLIIGVVIFFIIIFLILPSRGDSVEVKKKRDEAIQEQEEKERYEAIKEWEKRKGDEAVEQWKKENLETLMKQNEILNEKEKMLQFAREELDISKQGLEEKYNEVKDVQFALDDYNNLTKDIFGSIEDKKDFYKNEIKTQKEVLVGIYIIVVNKKLTKFSPFFYIGQSKDIFKRWKQHLYQLDKKNDSKLYNDINKLLLNNTLTIDDLSFKILEECPANELDKNEKKYWELWIQDRNNYSFNTSKITVKTNNQSFFSEKLIEALQKVNWERREFNLSLFVGKSTKGNLTIYNLNNNKVNTIKLNDYLLAEENPIEKEININDEGKIDNIKLGVIPKETYEAFFI